jgi:hypothetical protein
MASPATEGPAAKPALKPDELITTGKEGRIRLIEKNTRPNKVRLRKPRVLKS